MGWWTLNVLGLAAALYLLRVVVLWLYERSLDTPRCPTCERLRAEAWARERERERERDRPHPHSH